MFGRSIKINYNQFAWTNSFRQPMYVSANKHQSMIQSIARSRLLILNTSEASKGLKSITVKNDVLTLVYADDLYGSDALTSTKVKTYLQLFTYGRREDASHHLWHFGQMNFEEPHVHIINTYFDSKNFTRLIKPRQFSDIITDLAKNHPEYLNEKDADYLKFSYKNFFNKHTSFVNTNKHRLFALMMDQKKTTSASKDKNEKAVVSKCVR